MDKYQIGLERAREVLGEQADQNIEMLSQICPDFAKYAVEFVYGDIFCRPLCTDKTRELAIVSCLIGQHNTGMPLKAHLSGMLQVGWTQEEILELLILLAPYVGFPSALEAMSLFKVILDERVNSSKTVA